MSEAVPWISRVAPPWKRTTGSWSVTESCTAPFSRQSPWAEGTNLVERDFLKVIQSEIPENGVLISVGLPGSWKSPVTEEIARVKGFHILRSDMIRLEVLKGQDIFDNRVASS